MLRVISPSSHFSFTAFVLCLLTACIINTTVFAQTNTSLYSEYVKLLPHINSVEDIHHIDAFIKHNQNTCKKDVFDGYSLEFLLYYNCLKIKDISLTNKTFIFDLTDKCLNVLPQNSMTNKSEYAVTLYLMRSTLYLQENWVIEAENELKTAELYMQEKSSLYYAVSGMLYYQKGDYTKAKKEFKKAFVKNAHLPKIAYIMYAKTCFAQKNNAQGFEILNDCLMKHGINSEQPELDPVIVLYYNSLNVAAKADVENLYDIFDSLLSVIDLDEQNAELISFLINQRRFLAAHYAFLPKENDLKHLQKYL